MTNWPLRSSIACPLLALALLTVSGPAGAQQAPPAPKPAKTAPRTVKELARLVEEQRLLIEATEPGA